MDNPTNADIYHAIGRLEGKFDAWTRLGLPKRVSSLERSRAWVIGAVTVIGTAIAFIFKGNT